MGWFPSLDALLSVLQPFPSPMSLRELRRAKWFSIELDHDCASFLAVSIPSAMSLAIIDGLGLTFKCMRDGVETL